MRKSEDTAKKTFIISMAVLFCLSILLTGCSAGRKQIQSENSSGQPDSAVSPGTTASESPSGDKSTVTEVTGESSNAASSESAGSQASTTNEASPEATSEQTSTAAGTSKETTGKQASQGTNASPGATDGQASKDGSTGPETTGEHASPASNSSQGSEPVKYEYYLAGSFNGYVPNDPNFKMKPIPGKETWYTFTVLLTENNRDELYDGHWYKVTTGNWNDPSYGIDNYCIENPPIKYLDDGTPIGLGSIWVDENIELTVMFDSVNKIVYDNANGKPLPKP